MKTFDILPLCTGFERKLSFFTFVALKKSKFRTVLRKFAKSRFRKYFMFTKFIQRFSFPRKFRKHFREKIHFLQKSKYFQAGSCICSCITHACAKTFKKQQSWRKFSKTYIFANIFAKFYQILYNNSYTEKRKTVCRLYNISYTEIKKAKLAEG